MPASPKNSVSHRFNPYKRIDDRARTQQSNMSLTSMSSVALSGNSTYTPKTTCTTIDRNESACYTHTRYESESLNVHEYNIDAHNHAHNTADNVLLTQDNTHTHSASNVVRAYTQHNAMCTSQSATDYTHTTTSNKHQNIGMPYDTHQFSASFLHALHSEIDKYILISEDESSQQSTNAHTHIATHNTSQTLDMLSQFEQLYPHVPRITQSQTHHTVSSVSYMSRAVSAKHNVTTANSATATTHTTYTPRIAYSMHNYMQPTPQAHSASMPSGAGAYTALTYTHKDCMPVTTATKRTVSATVTSETIASQKDINPLWHTDDERTHSLAQKERQHNVRLRREVLFEEPLFIIETHTKDGKKSRMIDNTASIDGILSYLVAPQDACDHTQSIQQTPLDKSDVSTILVEFTVSSKALADIQNIGVTLAQHDTQDKDMSVTQNEHTYESTYTLKEHEPIDKQYETHTEKAHKVLYVEENKEEIKDKSEHTEEHENTEEHEDVEVYENIEEHENTEESDDAEVRKIYESAHTQNSIIVINDSENSSPESITTRVDTPLYEQSILELTDRENQIKQIITQYCESLDSLNSVGHYVQHTAAFESVRIGINTLKLFGQNFPLRYKCTHKDLKACDVCEIAAVTKQIDGMHILGKVSQYNLRISRICPPIAACLFLLGHGYVDKIDTYTERIHIRRTVAHEKYIYNIKAYILTPNRPIELLIKISKGIFKYYDSIIKQQTDTLQSAEIHNIAATALRYYYKELKQLFMHKFVVHIKKSFLETCAQNNENTTHLRQLFMDSVPESYVVSSDITHMRRDAYEYAHRMARLKQELSQDNKLAKFFARKPYMSCVPLLFSTSEIFDALLKNRYFIGNGHFASISRRLRTSALSASKVKILEFDRCKQQKNCITNYIMSELDLFKRVGVRNEVRHTIASEDNVYLEKKRYLMKVRDICHQLGEDEDLCIQIVDACIELIDQRVSVTCIPKGKKDRAKRLISFMLKLDDILQKHSFIHIDTPTPPTDEGKVMYGKFDLQDVIDHTLVVDAIDVSLLHIFRIMKKPLNNARNVMLHVLLNIWFHGSGKVHHDTDFQPLQVCLHQYDENLMDYFLAALTQVQADKLNYLHTVLPYERSYLGLNEHTSCAACDIVHAGHYTNSDEQDVCISLLCLDAAKDALLFLLPSSTVRVNLTNIFKNRTMDKESLIKFITAVLVKDTRAHSVVDTRSLLNKKLLHIFGLGHETT